MPEETKPFVAGMDEVEKIAEEDSPVDMTRKLFLLSGGIVFSTKDVFDGYVDGFRRCLVPLDDYTMFGSLLYFSLEFVGRDILGTLADIRERHTHVVVIDGLHPQAWMMHSIHERLGLHTSVIATEDPHGFDLTHERFLDRTCYDIYFTNERNVAEMFPDQATYLPTGVNTSLIHRIQSELPYTGLDYDQFESDVCFIGACYPNRQKLFEEMLPFFKKHKLRVRLMGHFGMVPKESPLWTSGYVYNATVDFKDTLRVYLQSKMCINTFRDPFEEDPDRPTNTQFKIPADSLNPRCYEVPACGCLLMTENTRGEVQTVFEPDKEIATFDDREELEAKILYYLEHDDEREAMCARAKERAWANHSYAHRAAAVFERLKEAR